MSPLEFQRRRQNQEAAAEISDAARLANELQAEFPGMSRSNALSEAERIQRKHGLGLTLAKPGEVDAHAGVCAFSQHNAA
jgi:hypothetical protein